ncbi:serine hydrolase domain-containing protein [Streptomyces sp. NPDC019937]|uniref:serine hydrolase domain-containing protein n=1 Tax=Streptomyces sp. NPDC019937 TaxID=3154787 RepID=UPI0033D13187
MSAALPNLPTLTDRGGTRAQAQACAGWRTHTGFSGRCREGCADGDDGPPRKAAATFTTARSTTAESTNAAGHARLRELLHRLTDVDGGPGALVEVRDRRGSTVLTSGVANVKSHAPVRRDSRFRIGSMTKPFVARVMLQLVAEHRVALDAPVERYLPGVVRGHGNEGG